MEKNYNFHEIERKMQKFWEEEQIYKFDRERAGEIYSVDTPPPTVNGSLHIGHIFSYVQAEIIARFRRMQGYNVFYPFGFDDNGLPTERLVEKETGVKAKDLPRGEFIQKCAASVEKYEAEFKELWKSLGFSVDWSLEYRTINPEVLKISQELFLRLVQNGKAYTKSSPVLWCTECRTSIAQAELETADLDSVFCYLPFKTNEDIIPVATTRPELLYGCVCLFVNPSDERYAHYIGSKAVVPLYGYEIPVLADDEVDMDKGTGAVMCATFGDSTDAEWYGKYNLPYRKIILPDGKIAEEVPFISGLTIAAARTKIIQLLDENALIIKTEKITHAVAVHERCGKATEIIPSRQWYIDILSEKDRFKSVAEEINWYPLNMKARYLAWVENLKWDWCISRQRYFGVPFPVWYCKNCGKAVFPEIERLPVNPLECEYGGLCGCGSGEFIPESAVFDTWATSSVTPQINERSGIRLAPMSMRTHAHDIIRTWTFYSIVRSLYHTGNIPWKDLMISGFVLAKKGEKIGKSKSNSDLSPANLININSADVLRYWSANSKLGTDTFFDAGELSAAKRFITKLWNASKFAISHLQDVDYSAECKILPVDCWIMERTNEVVIKASDFLRRYEIGLARHEIDELFWKDFCDYYIEIVKDRLYKPEIHGEKEKRGAQYALYYATLNILKLYSIYIPHITDYIYREFFMNFEGEKSIHLLKWITPEVPAADLLLFGEKIKEVIADVRRYKSQNKLSMKDRMDRLEITVDPKYRDRIALSEKDLKACSNADEIVVKF